MYTILNDVRIILNFEKGFLVKIGGPDAQYYAEVVEYVKNDNNPKMVESFSIHLDQNTGPNPYFLLPIEFYGDFEFHIYRFTLNHGHQRIFTHRYNDFGKLVKFNLETENYEECLLWSKRVELYSEIHGCIPLVYSKFDDINKSFESYYKISGIDIYKTYRIGRFPKDSTDWRTKDHRKQGTIWFGNWKTFWSYQHPRKWNELTSQEIADDILGL